MPKMSSYQKLKFKCEQLEGQLNFLKNALTIYQAVPEPVANEDGSVSLEMRWAVVRNKMVNEECKRQLQFWVAENLDEKTIMRLLEMKKELENGK